ncbi:MAG: sigma-70 family RNA polymerase sigma factor [bacterium]
MKKVKPKKLPKPETTKTSRKKPSKDSAKPKTKASKQASTPRLVTTKPVASPAPKAVTPPIPVTEPSKKVTDGKERQLEDKALVRRARGGEQRAYSELVKRHKRGIERLIRPITRTATTDEIEDLVQEAFTKAFLHLNSYSEEYAFSTWLYRIATNHAIDHLRRKKLSMFSISAPQGGGDRSDDESKDFEIVDNSWVPEQLMLSDERSRIIEEAIEQLPENYKKIIKLRHNDDMEYDEIAKVLNLPMGTVKVHLHRARAALGKMLEGKV